MMRRPVLVPTTGPRLRRSRNCWEITYPELTAADTPAGGDQST